MQQPIAGDRQIFDVIVLGVGAMGSATCYYLAKKGVRVLGLEQFDIPNELGSHTGESRLVRKAYFEHPGYVPLLERAYENWKHLEEITGEQVYFETGLFYFGPPGHSLIKGVQASSHQFEIPLQTISNEDLRQQYQQMNIPAEYESILEPAAGFITPAKAIHLFTEKARQSGAVIKTKLQVLDWRKTTAGIEIFTSSGIYRSKKLVITAGPWAGKLIKSFSPHLRVTRQVMAWMNCRNPSKFELGNFPCWILSDKEMPGIYYGFPILPQGQFHGFAGFKLAHHYPGEPADPGEPNRQPDATDEANLVRILHQYFPGEYLATAAMQTCRYTMTADENFIIDFLPGYEEDVMIAAGFSGHGFKFAAVVGEIMSDLALNGGTTLPIDFLNARRFVNDGLGY